MVILNKHLLDKNNPSKIKNEAELRLTSKANEFKIKRICGLWRLQGYALDTGKERSHLRTNHSVVCCWPKPFYIIYLFFSYQEDEAMR